MILYRLLLSSIANLVSPTSKEVLEHILTGEQLQTIKSTLIPEVPGMSQNAAQLLEELIPARYDKKINKEKN